MLAVLAAGCSMAQPRLLMRQIRELLRLHFEQHLSRRELVRSSGLARSTVDRLLLRFTQSGLTWPFDPDLDDAELERRLYRGHANAGVAKAGPRPDYAQVVNELSRKGVTRRLLWTEYRDRHAAGIGYSVFCAELAAFRADRDLVYRNDPVPGEKGYFDFAGMTLRYRVGQQVAQAQFFVAALGYSNAIFAYAYPDQTASSWLDGQHRAFVAFGGVPKVGVPDNPKALVAKPDRYEPRLSRIYSEFAEHYGIAIVPARVRKPRDKGAVEGAVKIVEMRVLAAARDRIFDSLDALNAWLREGMSVLNATPFQKRVGSRDTLLAHEREHLLPLPSRRFEAPVYLCRKVARDYHVDVQRQYYSVPHAHVGRKVDVRLTGRHVEVLLEGQRVALHRRAPAPQRYVTDPAHMPAHHQAYRDPKLHRRAAALGPSVLAVIEALFARRQHPEQAIRSAQGILAQARDHGAAALNEACARALERNTVGYENIRRYLHHAATEPALPLPEPVVHEHIRGSAYYAQEADHVA